MKKNASYALTVNTCPCASQTGWSLLQRENAATPGEKNFFLARKKSIAQETAVLLLSSASPRC